MNKLVFPIVIVIVVVAGAWFLLRPQPQTLGKAPDSPSASAGTTAAPRTLPIGQITKDLAGQKVQFEGTILEECPHSGCWAVIKDDSGQIRIDTNEGGFALPLNKEGHHIKVVGTVKVKENGDLEITASSAEVK